MGPEEFRDIRLELILTQADLADRLGCSRKQVNNYEAGRRRITEEKAAAIRALYENSPPRNGELYRESGPAGRRDVPIWRNDSSATGIGWAGLIDALSGLLEPYLISKDDGVAAPALKQSSAPVVTASVPVAKPTPTVAMTAATGPLHTDFVNQHNAEQQRRSR